MGGPLQGSGTARPSPEVLAYSQIPVGIRTPRGLVSNADSQASPPGILIQRGWAGAWESAFLTSTLGDSGVMVCGPQGENSMPQTVPTPRPLLSCRSSAAHTLEETSILLPFPHFPFPPQDAEKLPAQAPEKLLGKVTPDLLITRPGGPDSGPADSPLHSALPCVPTVLSAVLTGPTPHLPTLPCRLPLLHPVLGAPTLS